MQQNTPNRPSAYENPATNSADRSTVKPVTVFMETPQVTIATNCHTLRRHVTRSMVAVGCGVNFCCLTPEEAKREAHEERAMFIVDLDDTDACHFLDELYRNRQEAIVLVLSRDLQNPYLSELLTDKQVRNVIARHGLSASQEIIDEVELITTFHKLFTSDIFGIEKYLCAPGVKIAQRVIRNLDEKQSAQTALTGFLSELCCQASLIPQIVTVADELLMNAMFDAPRDANGNQKYVDRPRNRPLQLESSERIEMQYACDGRYLAISIKDSFGSLDQETIMNYLDPHFRGSRSTVKTSGSAGIGLALVFNSITQLVINITPGECTEIIALFYIRSGSKGFRTSGKSLNVFTAR